MGGEEILHYRVIGPLGQGGMGEVVLAMDERLERRVALKFLSRSFAADPQARERLHREARSLAALSHPHIATIHALEESEGRLFLVMEYVEGETLAHAIARRPFPVEQAVSVGLAMADALAQAHARGIVHRDVKPANILIRGDGKAVLTDFGIADLESATRLTAEGYTPGTVAYMSPEQARGARVDARSDVFSLGAVLYEALTGTRPFSGDRPESALYAVQHHEPESPTALRAGIPLELDRIVMKCLRKDPSLRYQHADDLAADLRALRVGSAAPGTTAAGRTATVPVGPGSGAAAGTASAAGAIRGKRIRRIATLAVAALLAVALVYLVGKPGSDEHGSAEAAEKSIAVLSFQNLAEPGDPSGTSPVATSLLSVGLGETQSMPVVSAHRIQVLLKELGKNGKEVRAADALEVARKAGASHVITGFIYSLTPEVVLGAEVASTGDGKVLTATRVRTPAGPAALFAAVDSLTRSLTEGLARSGFAVRSSTVDVAGLTTRDPVAYRAYARGLDHLYAGSTEEATREFHKAVQADSTFALAWYYSAIATWWSGDFLAAEEEVRAAQRAGSRLTARDREGLAALDALIRSKYIQAVDSYRALLTRYPDDKEFAYGLGEALYHQGTDLPGARAALEQAIRIDPSFGTPYYHLVDIATEEEDFDTALGYLRRLESADPGDPGLYLFMARVQAAMGDPRGGIASDRRALAITPNLPHAWFDIMRLQLFQGQIDSAKIAITELRKLGDRKAWEDARIAFLMGTGRLHEAIRVFRSLPPEEIGNPQQRLAPLRAMYATALLETGDVEGAIAEMKTHIADPMMARALGRGAQADDLADLYIERGRIADAEKLLREYDRSLGDSPTGREILNRTYIEGMILLAKGRPREAIPILERSRPMSPPGRSQAQRGQTLARAFVATGDTSRAVTELERVISRTTLTLGFTAYFESMTTLASLYEKTGRREEALRLYRRVERQYRDAEPGFQGRDVAQAGIRRLTGT